MLYVRNRKMLYSQEAASEKYHKEAEEKEEMLYIKIDEFYHKSMNDDLVKRGKMRKCLNILKQ